MCFNIILFGKTISMFYSYIVNLLNMFWILNEWTRERFIYEYLNTQYIKYMNM